MREDIAVEAGQGVGTKSVGEEMISSDALIGDCYVARVLVSLQAVGENVGPAVVAVGGGSMAVSDGVAEHDDGGGAFGSEDIDGGDLIPVVDVFGVGEIGGGGFVSVDDVRRSAGTGVAGFRGGRSLEVERDRNVRESVDLVSDGVGNVVGAGRDGDVGRSGEGERLVGAGIDLSRGWTEWVRDMDRADVEGFDSEGVGDVNAESRASEREMKYLADGGVAEIVGRKGVVGLGDLLGAGPGDDPDGGLVGSLKRCGAGGDQGQGEYFVEQSCHCRI